MSFSPTGRLLSLCNGKRPSVEGPAARRSTANAPGGASVAAKGDDTVARKFCPFTAYCFSPHVTMSTECLAPLVPPGTVAEESGDHRQLQPEELSFTWAAMDQRGNLMAFDASQEK